MSIPLLHFCETFSSLPFTPLHPDSSCFIRIHPAFSGFVPLHPDSPRFIPIHPAPSGFVLFRPDSPRSIRIHSASSRFTPLHPDLSCFVRIHPASSRFLKRLLPYLSVQPTRRTAFLHPLKKRPRLSPNPSRGRFYFFRNRSGRYIGSSRRCRSWRHRPCPCPRP